MKIFVNLIKDPIAQLDRATAFNQLINWSAYKEIYRVEPP